MVLQWLANSIIYGCFYDYRDYQWTATLQWQKLQLRQSMSSSHSGDKGKNSSSHLSPKTMTWKLNRKGFLCFFSHFMSSLGSWNWREAFPSMLLLKGKDQQLFVLSFLFKVSCFGCTLFSVTYCEIAETFGLTVKYNFTISCVCIQWVQVSVFLFWGFQSMLLVYLVQD